MARWLNERELYLAVLRRLKRHYKKEVYDLILFESIFWYAFIVVVDELSIWQLSKLVRDDYYHPALANLVAKRLA